jgi:alpha-N-arabinofuranosidase
MEITMVKQRETDRSVFSLAKTGTPFFGARGERAEGHSRRIALALVATLATRLSAVELHVATNGEDAHPGTPQAPLRTIQRAADLAQPGDTITVHQGVYRERVNPPRGGVSDEKRIVYQAAPGEKVVITGSEVVTGWEKVQNNTWMVKLPNALFGKFNPFADLLKGHWFDPKGRDHHTGSVYLNGAWLVEAAELETVLAAPKADAEPLWFARVDGTNTVIWAQFRGVDPNKERVEVNARQTVFYPDQPGRNYITVRGFTLTQAATPWAPPTTEQIGLIGTHWSKGWLIESNTISHSVCAGLTLGIKNMGEFSGNLAGYTQMIDVALRNGGWSKDNIGHHLVRGNRIAHCEQAGICGSLGGAFSLIEGNEVSHIHVRRLFHGQEQGGIKLHGAVDTVIRGNCVHDTPRGLWLDWMGQGATISGNLAYNNSTVDLYLEVNHGPALVANNVFLSTNSLSNLSRGMAFAHNLFAGRCATKDTTRITPYLEAHSTTVAGKHANKPGDDRFYNNIFAGRSFEKGGLYASLVGEYTDPELPVTMKGNVFIRGAVPHKKEGSPSLFQGVWPDLTPLRKADGVSIEWIHQPEWQSMVRALVTTELLGRAGVTGLRFERPDGSPIRIATDYFGKPRSETNPFPGPFEYPGNGARMLLNVWSWKGVSP